MGFKVNILLYEKKRGEGRFIGVYVSGSSVPLEDKSDLKIGTKKDVGTVIVARPTS